VGLVFGVTGAAATGRLLQGLLYGVSGFDLLTFATAVLMLALVAVGASYLPAIRAVQTDPNLIVRYE
jgi:ABC-type lipoprotein release transport system permease subunit